MVLTSLEVTSLNCSGLNDKFKRMLVFDFCKKSKCSIIFLQETKTNFKDENRIRADWGSHGRIFINSSDKNSSCGGCILLINNDQIVVENTVLTADGRCIVMDVVIDGCRFHVVNTYFPIEGKEKKPFIRSLYPLISSNFPIIWGGDFNLVVDPRMGVFHHANLIFSSRKGQKAQN